MLRSRLPSPPTPQPQPRSPSRPKTLGPDSTKPEQDRTKAPLKTYFNIPEWKRWSLIFNLPSMWEVQTTVSKLTGETTTHSLSSCNSSRLTDIFAPSKTIYVLKKLPNELEEGDLPPCRALGRC